MNKKITTAFRYILSTLLLFQTFLAGVLAQTEYIGPVAYPIGVVQRITNLLILLQFVLGIVIFLVGLGRFFFGKRQRKNGKKDERTGKLFTSGVLLGISSFLEIMLVNFLNVTIIIDNPTWLDKLLRQGYPTFVIIYALFIVTTVLLVKIWRKKESN